MKNTNSKQFKQMVFNYLADSLYDFEGDYLERVARIKEKFTVEYDYPDNRRRTPNKQDRIAEWLAGLPLSIDYSNVDIIARAEQWHETKLTDKQAEKIVDNWFNFLAFKTLQMWESVE